MPEAAQAAFEPAQEEESSRGPMNSSAGRRLEVIKAVLMPLVTVFLGFYINTSLDRRQASENNLQLYTEMMGRREESDTSLRKDMFNTVLGNFMEKNQKLPEEKDLARRVLSLELLAYNFHDSLDMGPLFKNLQGEIPQLNRAISDQMIARLEKLAGEISERQLSALTDREGIEFGDVLLEHVAKNRAFLEFGSHTVPDPTVHRGEGTYRVCLSLQAGQEHHYRQFRLEVLGFHPDVRELEFRLYVTRPLSQAECRRYDRLMPPNREIETDFWAGLFDFPMVDNTRLSYGERCAVTLKSVTPDEAQVALAYFPASRASLKDKPYYDELIHNLTTATGHTSGEDQP